MGKEIFQGFGLGFQGLTPNSTAKTISPIKIDETTGEELSPELSNRYIRTQCELGNIDTAMNYISHIESLGFRLNYVTYITLLSALAHVGRTLEIEAIYEEMIVLGFTPTLKLYNLLLKAFLRKGMLTLADRVVESMSDAGVLKDRETYEILLGYYVSAGRLNDSWDVVGRMRKDGFEPDSFVYSRIIGIYRDNGMWKKGLDVINFSKL